MPAAVSPDAVERAERGPRRARLRSRATPAATAPPSSPRSLRRRGRAARGTTARRQAERARLGLGGARPCRRSTSLRAHDAAAGHYALLAEDAILWSFRWRMAADLARASAARGPPPPRPAGVAAASPVGSLSLLVLGMTLARRGILPVVSIAICISTDARPRARRRRPRVAWSAVARARRAAPRVERARVGRRLSPRVRGGGARAPSRSRRGHPRALRDAHDRRSAGISLARVGGLAVAHRARASRAARSSAGSSAPRRAARAAARAAHAPGDRRGASRSRSRSPPSSRRWRSPRSVRGRGSAATSSSSPS